MIRDTAYMVVLVSILLSAVLVAIYKLPPVSQFYGWLLGKRAMSGAGRRQGPLSGRRRDQPSRCQGADSRRLKAGAPFGCVWLSRLPPVVVRAVSIAAISAIPATVIAAAHVYRRRGDDADRGGR